MLQPVASFTRCPQGRSHRRAAARLVTLDITLAGQPFVTLMRRVTRARAPAKVTKWKKWKGPRFHPLKGYIAEALPGAALSTGSRPPVENPGWDTCRSR